MDVRDYLATILTLHDGSRTSVVVNVNMEHFEQGRKDRDGNFVVPAPTHKTNIQYGPACLIFKPHIYQYTKIYVELMRSNFAGTSGPLLPNQHGANFKGSNRGKRISEVFKEANVRRDISVTATKIHKFHATSVLHLNPEDRQFVHNHMAHSGKMAQAKYMTPDVVERSTGTLRMMQKNLHGEGPSPKESPMKRKREESESEEGILSTLSTAKMGSTLNITLTDKDKAVLKTLFKEEINK